MEVPPPPAAAPAETASDTHSSVVPFSQSLTQTLETGPPVSPPAEEPSSQAGRREKGVRFSKKREGIAPLKAIGLGDDAQPPSLSGEPTSPLQQPRSPLRSPSGSLQAPRQGSPGLPRQNSAPSDTSSGIMASASVVFNPLEKRGVRKFGTLKQQHLAKPGSANANASGGELNALHRSPATTAADAGWEGLAAGSAEVTQAEYSNYARMFNTFDTDGSGSIDVDELACIMSGLNIQLDADELQGMMQRYGRPGAGAGSAYVIDFPEFVEMMSGHKAKLMLEGVLRPEDGSSRDPLDNAYIQESLSSKYFSVDSSVRWLTDALVFLSMCYYSVTVPIRWCYDVLEGEALTVVAEVFFHGIFVWDVVLRFNTVSEARVDDEPGPQDSDEKVTRGAIARRYLRGTFVLDALTSMPIEFFFVSQDSLWPQFFRALKLAKLVKIPGLYGMTGSLRVLTPANITFVYSFVPIINLIFWLSIMCHCFTICWAWLSENAEKDSVQGLTEEEIVALISSRPLNYYRQEFSDQYLNSLYVVLYTLTTVGYGDVAIQTKGQKLLACGMFVTGAVCNGFVVSKINKVLSRTDIQSERKAKMVEMVNLLRFFRIPRYVQREILAFQYHLLDNNLSSAYSEIIDALPNNMQDQLSLYLKIKLVSKVPLFNQVHEECKIAIAQALRNSVATPSEFIICAGEVGNEMFFIGYGIAEVLRPTGQHLATIQKGQFFGEMAMLFARDGESTRTASVRALTYCDLYCLIKASFLEILARFPIFRKMVDREASARGIGSPKSPGKENKPAWDKPPAAAAAGSGVLPECLPPPPHPASASPANQPLTLLPLAPPPPLARQHQRQEGRGATPVQSRSEGSVDKWGEAVLDAEGATGTPLRAGARRATVTSRKSFTDEDDIVVCESLSFKSLWKNGDNMSRMKSGRSLRGSHVPPPDGVLTADHDTRLAKIEALLVRLVHRQSGMSAMSGGDDEIAGRREHSGEPFIAIQRTQSIHSALQHRVEAGGGGGGGGTSTPLSTPVR